MDTRKDFVVKIVHRASGSTWDKNLDCKNPAIEGWATIKDSNKYAGTFSFWMNEDDEKETLHKVGTRAVENALEKICTDPNVTLPIEELEMKIMYSNKYNDVYLLDDDCISFIVQVAVFGDVVDL
jgi:hypothetical protein